MAIGFLFKNCSQCTVISGINCLCINSYAGRNVPQTEACDQLVDEGRIATSLRKPSFKHDPQLTVFSLKEHHSPVSVSFLQKASSCSKDKHFYQKMQVRMLNNKLQTGSECSFNSTSSFAASSAELLPKKFYSFPPSAIRNGNSAVAYVSTCLMRASSNRIVRFQAASQQPFCANQSYLFCSTLSQSSSLSLIDINISNHFVYGSCFNSVSTSTDYLPDSNWRPCRNACEKAIYYLIDETSTAMSNSADTDDGSETTVEISTKPQHSKHTNGVQNKILHSIVAVSEETETHAIDRPNDDVSSNESVVMVETKSQTNDGEILKYFCNNLAEQKYHHSELEKRTSKSMEYSV